MTATQVRQDKVLPRKENPQVKERGRVVFSTALEHVTLVGECDGSPTTIAKCNGSSVTIKVIKNEGKCDIEVFCIDVQNKEIPNTRQKITPEGILPIYVAPNNTNRVDFECKKTTEKSECKVSMAV
jgi:hypothetical protein